MVVKTLYIQPSKTLVIRAIKINDVNNLYCSHNIWYNIRYINYTIEVHHPQVTGNKAFLNNLHLDTIVISSHN